MRTTPVMIHELLMPCCRYGPRESRKAAAYSNTGRLTCDVKLAALCHHEPRQVRPGGHIPPLAHTCILGTFT